MSRQPARADGPTLKLFPPVKTPHAVFGHTLFLCPFSLLCVCFQTVCSGVETGPDTFPLSPLGCSAWSSITCLNGGFDPGCFLHCDHACGLSRIGAAGSGVQTPSNANPALRVLDEGGLGQLAVAQETSSRCGGSDSTTDGPQIHHRIQRLGSSKAKKRRFSCSRWV